MIGSAPAGHPFEDKLGAGEAVRIFTGGVVPESADAVRDGRLPAEPGALIGDHIERVLDIYAAACRIP